MRLSATEITLGYGTEPVVENLTLTLDPRQITAVIGPNGSGKSTVLAALAGQLAPWRGTVSLNGKDIGTWPRRLLAQSLAFLPQQPEAPEGIRVGQMVAYGRFAHRQLFSPLSDKDHALIDGALQQTDTSAFADRLVSDLSGGERQRVWIAMALAQDPKLVILDEPTSYLDLGFQYQVLDVLETINRQQGLGIIMVVHDINHACFYADRVVALKAGAIVADGPPGDVVTADLVAELYNLPVRTLKTNNLGRSFFLPAHL